jgi:hypothetical protein
VAIGFTVTVAATHRALRSAYYGITLSNGVEVLVSPQTYRAIVSQYGNNDEPDAWQRWDHAVLDVLRPDRPNEWKYLVRSLGYRVAPEGFGARRQRLTVHR